MILILYKQTFFIINYIYSNLGNQLITKQTQKLQYIFINKYVLENINIKKQTEKEMLLAKNMHIIEKIKKLKENLMKEDKIKDKGDNSNNDIINR